MDFVATTDFNSPYVVATGMPHRPTQIKTKRFKKGQIITGKMIEDGGKPAFVLWSGVVVVPLSCVKKIIVKDINLNPTDTVVSSAEGDIRAEKPRVPVVSPKDKAKAEDKKKYIDGLIIGAIAGGGGAYLAQKKGWIAVPDSKNLLIGAVVGGFLGAYLVYRLKK